MFKGKNILITGASSGIGESIAQHLSTQGACVILIARNTEKLENISKLLANKSHIFSFDLSRLENINEIFEYINKLGIKLDGFVHCAGISINSPVKSNDVESMSNVLNLNFCSFVEICKYFSKKKYSNDNSSIVALSSIASLRSNKSLSIYSASKAALNSAVNTIALEFLPRKIRANAILPAYVKTQMYEQQILEIDNFEHDLLARQPLGVIPPEYIAKLVSYLLSDDAKYITGQNISIDSGFLLM